MQLKRLCILHINSGDDYKADLNLIQSMIKADQKVLVIVNDSNQNSIFLDLGSINIRNVHFETFKPSTKTDWLKSRFENHRNISDNFLIKFISNKIHAHELSSIYNAYKIASQGKAPPKKIQASFYIKFLKKLLVLLSFVVNFGSFKRANFSKYLLVKSYILKFNIVKNLDEIKNIEERLNNQVIGERASFALKAFNPDTVLCFGGLNTQIAYSVKKKLPHINVIENGRATINKKRLF